MNGKNILKNIEIRQEALCRPVEASFSYGDQQYLAVLDFSAESDDGYDFKVYPIADGKPQILNCLYSDFLGGGGLGAANMLEGISDFVANIIESKG
jgi:hypothetical protein